MTILNQPSIKDLASSRNVPCRWDIELLCVHVYMYAGTHHGCLVLTLFPTPSNGCSDVSGHLVYRAHTPDMLRPQQLFDFYT